MIEFFRRLFAPEQSGATARERLRLVLLSDHLSLAPDVVESLRNDLIAVISKYVEVDEANCDVSFEQQDRAVAVLANIPILAMRDRRPPGSPTSSVPPKPEPPARGDAVGAAYAVADPPRTNVVQTVSGDVFERARAASPYAVEPDAAMEVRPAADVHEAAETRAASAMREVATARAATATHEAAVALAPTETNDDTETPAATGASETLSAIETHSAVAAVDVSPALPSAPSATEVSRKRRRRRRSTAQKPVHAAG
jgi:cell division topological specificity factor